MQREPSLLHRDEDGRDDGMGCAARTVELSRSLRLLLLAVLCELDWEHKKGQQHEPRVCWHERVHQRVTWKVGLLTGDLRPVQLPGWMAVCTSRAVPPPSSLGVPYSAVPHLVDYPRV